MCKVWVHRIYDCEDSEKVGPNLDAHYHNYRWPEERCAGLPDGLVHENPNPNDPKAPTEDWLDCFDKPGCCEFFIAEALRKWARHRQLVGGANNETLRLGKVAEDTYAKHKLHNAAQTLNLDYFEEVRNEVLRRYVLHPDVGVTTGRSYFYKW